MSYQAITDIIVNPNQLQDLQLSNTVKDSPKQPVISFSDYLASMSDTENVESAAKTENTEKVSENQVKNEKEPEKKTEKTVCGAVKKR